MLHRYSTTPPSAFAPSGCLRIATGTQWAHSWMAFPTTRRGRKPRPSALPGAMAPSSSAKSLDASRVRSSLRTVDPASVRPTPGLVAHEKYGGVSKYAIGFWRYGTASPINSTSMPTATVAAPFAGWLPARRTHPLQSRCGSRRDLTAFARYAFSSGHSTAIDRMWNFGVRLRGHLPAGPTTVSPSAGRAAAWHRSGAPFRPRPHRHGLCRGSFRDHLARGDHALVRAATQSAACAPSRRRSGDAQCDPGRCAGRNHL